MRTVRVQLALAMPELPAIVILNKVMGDERGTVLSTARHSVMVLNNLLVFHVHKVSNKRVCSAVHFLDPKIHQLRKCADRLAFSSQPSVSVLAGMARTENSVGFRIIFSVRHGTEVGGVFRKSSERCPTHEYYMTNRNRVYF